ncbi:putative TRAFAC class myosin-kinesin ATPase superfamily, myosin family protein [Lyophyllum shimeji]|uniref:chitin synthase n=1 Tax=Lyophyllum shimeji TaxID=47721 RepID=A0A9P3PF67_LYOSH|nr:putative TRAFAC class myosin-kinesin ATPase superfamily, myosin family protein [Lyophyllum shimeji]
MASNTTQAVASGDLVDLVLQARFRADLPYTRIGATNLVVVNPYKTLANVNDISAKDYEERCYKDTSLPMVDSPKPLQPHLYDLAARVYLLMRRRNESQAVLSRGITGSWQKLKLASLPQPGPTSLDALAEGGLRSPNKLRPSVWYLTPSLHFNERGRISSSKVLTYGLDKSRLNRLTHEERSYHVFYPASCWRNHRRAGPPQPRRPFRLCPPRLLRDIPVCPLAPLATTRSECQTSAPLCAPLASKQKHMAAIFSVLVAILLLGNLQFQNGDAHDVSAYISNTHVLDHVARFLGTTPDDLSQVLTNKTSYVRKELYTVLLNAEQSAAQRDQFVRDLYSILFAFVVETANHRLAPSANDPPPHTQIIMLDQPGFQTRGPAGTSSMSIGGTTPLVSAYGQNTFYEFCINFTDELLQSYVLRNTFEDSVGYNAAMSADGIALPSIATMDNGACIELLRGAQLSERSHRKPGGLLGILNKSCSSYKSGKAGDHQNEDMLQELVSKFGVHASFVTNPGSATDRNLFGINHYSGPVSYDITGFVEKDSDLLDSAFVSLLRNSTDPFVAKLLSGPSLAAERHNKDENIIVQAQVSSRPLRHPTPIPSPAGELLPEEHQHLDPSKTYPVTAQLNFTLSEIFTSLDRTRLWNIACIRPNDSGSPNSFDKRRVKSQIRALLLPDVAARRSAEYVADYEIGAFCERYVPTMRGSEEERITQCARANGWHDGVDFARGSGRIWLSYNAWKVVEDTVRATEKEQKRREDEDDEGSVMPDDGTEYTHGDNGGLAPGAQSGFFGESADNLLAGGYQEPNAGYGGGGLNTPNSARGFGGSSNGWDEDDKKGAPPYSPLGKTEGLVVKESPNAVEQLPTSKTRRYWLWVVWACTWWVPTFLMTHLGRMKRPDVRIAWREKLTIYLLILLLNGIVVFYIVEFGRLLCPNFDKAWSLNEVGQHQGQDDYWVTIQGVVYDVSNFVRGDHSDIVGQPSNGVDTLEALAGQDLTDYFPVPLTLGCPDLVTDNTLTLNIKNSSVTQTQAVHVSGHLQTQSKAMHADDWYTNVFLKTMKDFRKGPLVYERKAIASEASDNSSAKTWAIWDNSVYDLTNYFYSKGLAPTTLDQWSFINKDIADLFKQRAGQDITKQMNTIMAGLDQLTRLQNTACLKNVFKIGEVDYRKSARCQVQNYMLIVVSGILMGSVVLKFLAALQFGGRASPELQDKFVLCQVPCYTEGEDSLRRTIDSLAALNYDDKRKLIFIICDGNIIGSGNDRTTPRIVLDILGVDPKLDPEPLLFKSVGEGSKALNYGKVYSGLYEFEGHVVPYMVVVKVGKPTERSKPGNRGKRDSQILLLHYLNRVHFDAPMSPLELEIYHQMRNVIGIDPAFYEYIFTVDADTTVTPESLNRLVAASADDSSIIGICGETKLQNEEGSWWTMIQVYEYYISHHLSKAFESLFGSVTCLPGCFSLYRIRTADKGRPIIISNRIIDEYAEPNIDTLHKKNLFSLGEDRFLTTLLMKHFPTFKTKFCPSALAHTMAPESWRILFSQRRRWINSTVHNLCELVLLPELFGFCCFSMRFFVFIDLIGTLILPATVVYLVYLIIIVSTGHAALPTIAIVMIAVTYGLQAIIFILKREFMLLGWMVVYIVSYPIYSFFLPVYSFWCMDEFGWGNTRLVIGEGKDKKVIINEDEKFDESMIPLKKFSEYEAEAWETGTRHSDDTGYNSKPQSRRPPRSRDESPHTYQEASHSGDYYRDTNLTMNNSSNPNLRLGGSQHSHSNVSHHQPMSTQFGAPQLPLMPFGSGPGSVAGSEYGGMPMMMPQMPYHNTGSMYGMMGTGMMNPMMSAMFTGGSLSGSQSGFAPPSAPALGGQQRPISNFSLATTANPFAGPSSSTNPTDDELFSALRNYLSTQDLMTVTKKTAREAMMARFPKADLSSRKEFLNQSIDTILSES